MVPVKLLFTVIAVVLIVIISKTDGCCLISLLKADQVEAEMHVVNVRKAEHFGQLSELLLNSYFDGPAIDFTASDDFENVRLSIILVRCEAPIVESLLEFDDLLSGEDLGLVNVGVVQVHVPIL